MLFKSGVCWERLDGSPFENKMTTVGKRSAFFQLFRLLLIRAKAQIFIEDLILVQDERWRRG